MLSFETIRNNNMKLAHSAHSLAAWLPSLNEMIYYGVRIVGQGNVRCSNVENRLAQLDEKMDTFYT